MWPSTWKQQTNLYACHSKLLWSIIIPSLVTKLSMAQKISYGDYIRPHCDLGPKYSKQIFLHDTLAPNGASPYHVWWQNLWRFWKYCLDKHSLRFFYLHCDLALEHSNPFCFMRYTLAYVEVSSNQAWLQKDQKFRTNSGKSHILILRARAVTLTLKIANHFPHATPAHDDVTLYQVW